MTTMREGPAFPDLGGITRRDRVDQCSAQPSLFRTPAAGRTHRSARQSSVCFGRPSPSSQIWLTLGAVGLVVGLGYHVAVPRSYSAYATLYLAQAPGSDPPRAWQTTLRCWRPPQLGTVPPTCWVSLPSARQHCWAKHPESPKATTCSSSTLPGPRRAKPCGGPMPLAKAFLAFRSERLEQQTAVPIRRWRIGSVRWSNR